MRFTNNLYKTLMFLCLVVLSAHNSYSIKAKSKASLSAENSSKINLIGLRSYYEIALDSTKSLDRAKKCLDEAFNPSNETMKRFLNNFWETVVIPFKNKSDSSALKPVTHIQELASMIEKSSTEAAKLECPKEINEIVIKTELTPEQIKSKAQTALSNGEVSNITTTSFITSTISTHRDSSNLRNPNVFKILNGVNKSDK